MEGYVATWKIMWPRRQSRLRSPRVFKLDQRLRDGTSFLNFVYCLEGKLGWLLEVALVGSFLENLDDARQF